MGLIGFMSMKEFEGEISINRSHHSHSEDNISIDIDDKNSGCRIATIRASVIDFANALFSLRGQNCKYVLSNLELAGKIREHKDILVKIPKTAKDKTIEQALAEFEVDGWKGRVSDAKNHHRAVEYADKYTSYRVGFTRYVDGE